MFKKVWNDPVWSKVISVGILGIIAFLYALIQSRIQGITVVNVFKNLVEIKIKLIYVLSLIVLLIIIRMLFKKKNKNSFYSDKQIKLREFNKLQDSESGILFRWSVYFHLDDTPFIGNLTPFCTQHEGIPVRFVHNHCPLTNCKNSRGNIDIHKVKNHIESILINEWEKAK